MLLMEVLASSLTICSRIGTLLSVLKTEEIDNYRDVVYAVKTAMLRDSGNRSADFDLFTL